MLTDLWEWSAVPAVVLIFQALFAPACRSWWSCLNKEMCLGKLGQMLTAAATQSLYGSGLSTDGRICVLLRVVSMVGCVWRGLYLAYRVHALHAHYCHRPSIELPSLQIKLYIECSLVGLDDQSSYGLRTSKRTPLTCPATYE